MKLNIRIIEKRMLLIGFFLLVFNCLHSQVILEPDFIYVPVYSIEGSSELHNLAKETFAFGSKMSNIVYLFKESKSKVRFKQTDNYIFIIKSGGLDPSTMMHLQKMTVKKKKREITVLQSGRNVDINKDIISFNLKDLGNNVYQIVPETQLEPGEYTFLVRNVAYTFGID
jgi:hypothetical protein